MHCIIIVLHPLYHSVVITSCFLSTSCFHDHFLSVCYKSTETDCTCGLLCDTNWFLYPLCGYLSLGILKFM